MEEQLQNALASLINKSLEGLETATGILTEELPDVVYQLLLWYGVYNGILMITAVVGLCILSFYGRKIFNNMRTHEFDDDANEILSFIGFFVVIIGSLSLIIHLMNLTWLKIWIAPKIWLIEYAATLVK